MKILIATPLYPPDIKEPAPYVKELAARLARTHEVAILAYNHILEKIDKVTIVTIEKRAQVLIRLFRFYHALKRLATNHDILYVQNGPSVELPILAYLLTSFHTPKMLFRLGDDVPLKAQTGTLGSHVTRLLMKRALKTLSHDDTCELCDHPTTVIPRPLPRPEILPFTNLSDTEKKAYEASWQTHIDTLLTLFRS